MNSSLKNREITVVYHVPVTETAEGLSCNGAFGRYIDELARHCRRVHVYCPSTTRVTTDYRISAPNVSFSGLPARDTLLGTLVSYGSTARALLRHRGEWDIVNIRIPCYFGLLAFAIARWQGCPVFLLVVGDTRAVYRALNFRGVKRWLAWGWAELLEAGDRFMVKRAITFANGDALRAKYSGTAPSLHTTATASIRTSEVARTRKREIWPARLRLLYVGRLYREKGIPVLLKAAAELRRRGLDLTVTLVGDGKYESELRECARDLHLSEHVCFVGHVPYGPLLLDYYRSSDLFVLPSISEGLPRVLVEAMSQGALVVASRVGGVPSMVRHGYNGVLVEPGSVLGLVNAIEGVVHDRGTAATLIEHGFQTAMQYTVEAHVEGMIQVLNRECADSSGVAQTLTAQSGELV